MMEKNPYFNRNFPKVQVSLWSQHTINSIQWQLGLPNASLSCFRIGEIVVGVPWEPNHCVSMLWEAVCPLNLQHGLFVETQSVMQTQRQYLHTSEPHSPWLISEKLSRIRLFFRTDDPRALDQNENFKKHPEVSHNKTLPYCF